MTARRLSPFACLALCLVLVACQQGAAPASTAAVPKPSASNGPPPPPDAVPALATATPEAPKAPDLGEFRLVSVTLGKAVNEQNEVVAPQDVFVPADAIYASVLSVGSHQGLTLAARWTAADGTLVAETTQMLVPTTPTLTTYRVSLPQGWPPGRYEVAIAAQDAVLEKRAFEVR
jgi:hypothetical protein